MWPRIEAEKVIENNVDLAQENEDEANMIVILNENFENPKTFYLFFRRYPCSEAYYMHGRILNVSHRWSSNLINTIIQFAAANLC